MRQWQDVLAGEQFRSAAIKLTEQDIYDFAEAFDPQPYHLDRAAGDASIFGGLCASGWQIAAFASRLLTDTLAREGIDLIEVFEVRRLRWKRPLFDGESVNAAMEVLEVSADSPFADGGSVELGVTVHNQDGDRVADMACRAAIAKAAETA